MHYSICILGIAMFPPFDRGCRWDTSSDAVRITCLTYFTSVVDSRFCANLPIFFIPRFTVRSRTVIVYGRGFPICWITCAFLSGSVGAILLTCDHHLIVFLFAVCSAGCMFNRRLISSFLILFIRAFNAL